MLPGYKAPSLPFHTPSVCPSIHPSINPFSPLPALVSTCFPWGWDPLLCPSQVVEEQAVSQAAVPQAACSLQCRSPRAGTCAPGCPAPWGWAGHSHAACSPGQQGGNKNIRSSPCVCGKGMKGPLPGRGQPVPGQEQLVAFYISSPREQRAGQGECWEGEAMGWGACAHSCSYISSLLPPASILPWRLWVCLPDTGPQGGSCYWLGRTRAGV